MLEEIAGPGATIRVDGFTGGRLPTRDQIARIVVRRDAFSAEFHQVGQGRVEIATRPGVDRWRGNAGLTCVRAACRRATRRRRRRQGGHAGADERVCGRDRWCRTASRSRANIEGSSSEDTRGISAITPTGRSSRSSPQPFDNRDISVAHRRAADADDAVPRVVSSASTSERGNQGISELDLPERGYTTRERRSTSCGSRSKAVSGGRTTCACSSIRSRNEVDSRHDRARHRRAERVPARRRVDHRRRSRPQR